MAAVLFGAFLIAHGLVHLGVWATPQNPDAPFEPSHSWVGTAAGASAASMRHAAIVLAAIVAGLSVVAGVAVFAELSIWPATVIAAATASLLLIGAYYSPWLSIGVLIDIGLVLIALQPSPF
jgi:hypothetical protein